MDLKLLKLPCWPYEKAARRYAGVTHMDVSQIDQTNCKRYTQSMLKGYDLSISALAYYPIPCIRMLTIVNM